MRPALLLSLALSLSACKQTVTTPPGSVIVIWESKQATRKSVAVGKELGPRVTKELKLLAQPPLFGPVTLGFHLETAPLEIVEEGKSMRHTSPVDVRVVVDANADWTASGVCTDGPHYQMPSIVDGKMVTPEPMVLDCRVVLKFKSTFKDLTYSVDLRVRGDGDLAPTMPGGGVKIL